MQTARLNRNDTTAPTLRDKSMNYKVRYLFGNRFEVKSREDGRRYYVESTYFGGEFLARCSCPDKVFNHAPICKHELSVIRFERSRVASMQFN